MAPVQINNEKVDDKPQEIGDVLERLLLKKSEVGEYVVVGEERLVVSRENCPPVLLSANKHKPEIILVQQYSQQSQKVLNRPSVTETPARCGLPVTPHGKTPVKTRSLYTDLDVTGSPLKCPFMQDVGDTDLSPFTISLPASKKTTQEYLTYTPVSSAVAGFIASKFNLALKKMTDNIEEFIPLWVICNGQDSQGTVFIGVQRDGDGLTRTLVTSSGPHSGADDLPSLDHLIFHHTAVGPTKRVESVVEATYNVLTSDDEDKGSSLKLICNWKRPLTILSPPAPDSFTIAHVRVVCGDGRSAAHQMYQELSVLRIFVEGLSSGEVAWLIREDSSSMSQDLQHVFSSIKNKGQRQKREEDGGNDFDSMMEGKFFNRSQNMDFTDHLWSVLMRCESYQELKDSLGLVFKAVESEEVRPQIHVRNTTQIGMVLRNLMRGREGVPELSGLTPLHMLIEIGSEKIKRDYINIFQNGELATGEQLSWFISGGGSSNGSERYETVVRQLERLHVALQLVVALRTYLSLPQPSLSHFTAQVLKEMKEEEADSSHSFNLKLETLTVHKLLDRMKASTWEVNLSSSHSSFSNSLLAHISDTPLIRLPPSLSVSEDEDDVEIKKEDCDNDKEEQQYYCTVFRTVTDKYFV